MSCPIKMSGLELLRRNRPILSALKYQLSVAQEEGRAEALLREIRAEILVRQFFEDTVEQFMLSHNGDLEDVLTVTFDNQN